MAAAVRKHNTRPITLASPGHVAAVRSWSEGPIYAVAPMVGQCDYGFRRLCRQHGATVCWSEMLMARQFVTDEGYRIQALGRNGVRPEDRVVVQFAANTPEDFVQAALAAEVILIMI